MHRQQQSPLVQGSTLKMKHTARLPSPSLPSWSTSHLFFDIELANFSKKAGEEVVAPSWKTDYFSLDFLRGAMNWNLFFSPKQPSHGALLHLSCSVTERVSTLGQYLGTWWGWGWKLLSLGTASVVFQEAICPFAAQTWRLYSFQPFLLAITKQFLQQKKTQKKH